MGAFVCFWTILSFAPPAGAVPTITGAQVRPNPFTPNGDGIADSTELTFTPVTDSGADSLVVRVEAVRDADGTVLEVLLDDVNVAAAEPVLATWAPGVFPDGVYRFDVVVREAPDSATVSVLVTADSTPPSVSITALSPNPFDPSAGDTLSVSVAVASDSLTAASTTVTIRLGAVQVDSLGTISGAASATLPWDGRLQTNGAIADPGVYEVRAIARDLAANADTATLNVTVDTDAPVFDVALPDTLPTTSFPVEIAGNVTDSDAVAEVLVSVDGGTFVAVDSSNAPGASVDWLVVVDDPAPVPGFTGVTIRAVDLYGHEADHFQVIAFDSVAPVPSGTVALAPGPVRSGETVRLRTTWNLDDLEVRASFSDLDTGYVPPNPSSPGAPTHDAAIVNEGGGSYLVVYDVTAANARPAGSRRIVVTASTGFLSAADTLNVTLAPRLLPGGLVSLDRNRFDPLAGDAVTIAARFASVGVAVEIFDLSGRRVRFVEGTGSVAWDGRNEDGDVVASGVYLVRVRTPDDEELRKVAVVKGAGR